MLSGPKRRPKRLCCLGRKRLVAEEDDLMLEEGAADRFEGFVFEVLGEIDAGNLRAQRARQLAHADPCLAHPILRIRALEAMIVAARQMLNGAEAAGVCGRELAGPRALVYGEGARVPVAQQDRARDS